MDVDAGVDVAVRVLTFSITIGWVSGREKRFAHPLSVAAPPPTFTVYLRV